MTKRKETCLFCKSRKCNHRIVTPDLRYDEIACIDHVRKLEKHADAMLNGAIRMNLDSTWRVGRGEPYPVID